MKKILVISDNLPNQINGVVTTYNNLCKRASLDNYNLVFINPENFFYIACPGYPEIKLSLPLKIGQLITSNCPDHIHIATEGPIGLAARLWCDWHGYQYNTSYHTRFPEMIKKIYGMPEFFTYWYVRWFHKHSGKVLTTTETMKKNLIEHGFKNNILPWTRGVDRNVLKTGVEHARNNPPLLVYVGRISKEKNLEPLCELQNQYSVMIVGSGPHVEYLQKKYTNVCWIDYATGSNLAELYKKADVFVFPSKADTFGIVIIEALSQGTPVAAYPVAGPIDIIQPGITGYMNDNLTIAIEQCLTLDRKQIEQESLKWSWENCWQIFKENLIDLY